MTLLLRASLLASLFAGLPACVVADDGGGDGGPDATCPIGEAHVSSLTFDEVLCLTAATATTDGSPRFTMEAGSALSWEVSSFGGDDTVPVTLDDTNSSTFARYTREGLQWVALTGAIGGTPQGQSSLRIDSVDGDGFVGRTDGVAVPDAGNDSLDSVFVTIVVGE